MSFFKKTSKVHPIEPGGFVAKLAEKIWDKYHEYGPAKLMGATLDPTVAKPEIPYIGALWVFTYGRHSRGRSDFGKEAFVSNAREQFAESPTPSKYAIGGRTRRHTVRRRKTRSKRV